jgi:hypothetical protein
MLIFCLPQAKDLALIIEPVILNIFIPQIQINSRVWISGTIHRTDLKFIFINVSSINLTNINQFGSLNSSYSSS